MDTPCQPRRKLKRVLKKVDKLNSSTKILSQKKLKAAINTSLNSTNSIRSLKNNNYSLAMRLETVKQELKVLKEEKVDLIEENYGLREKVISLEQMLGDKETYIIEEVDRKFQDRVEGIKNVIRSLNSHMSNFCVDLEQLAQICHSRPSSLGSQNSDKVTLSPAFDKRRSASRDSGDCCFEIQPDGELTASTSKSAPGLDMSIVAEQSINEQNFEQQYSSSCAKMKNIERKFQSETGLPRRIRKSLNRWEHDEDACVNIAEIEQPNELLCSDIDSGITDVEQALSSNVTENLDEQLETNEHKKITSISKIKKTKKAPKQDSKLASCKDLHIANEFALINAHKMIMEKIDKDENLRPEVAGMTSGEQTIQIMTDMELTMPVDTTILTAANQVEPLETFRESLNPTNPRRQAKSSSECLDEQNSSQSSEELVPDAVTMRKLKSGQFKYAVGRKNFEGCRKEISSIVPRARSKSKKRIAELIEQLPQEEPKSIFDFHEKTPTFHPEKSSEALSVYSLGDESTTSPCVPLRKEKFPNGTDCITKNTAIANKPVGQFYDEVGYLEPLQKVPSNTPKKNSRVSRSRSRRTTKNSVHLLDVNTNTSEYSNEEEKDELTLIKGVTHLEPLKDCPDNTLKKMSKVSRSRSRRRTKNTDNSSNPNEDDIHYTNPVAQDCNDNSFIHLGIEITNSESLKPNDASKKLSKVSRSRSQRVRKDEDPSFQLSADVCDQNAEHLNDKTDKQFSLLGEGFTYMETLQSSPNNVPENVSKTSRSRSRRKTKNTDSLFEVDNNEVLNPGTESLNDEQKRFTLLGEGTTYSEPLKGSPLKTPNVNKRSRSQTQRLTRSTGRSLKLQKNGVTDNRTRSASRSRKSHLEKELDVDVSKDEFCGGENVSNSLVDQLCDGKDGSKDDLSVQTVIVAGDCKSNKNTELENLTNILESNSGVSTFISDEIISVNTVRGKRKGRPRKLKAVEKEMEREDTLDDRSESDKKNNSEGQIQNEANADVEKKSRSRRLKSQGVNCTDVHASISDLNELCENVLDNNECIVSSDLVSSQIGLDSSVNISNDSFSLGSRNDSCQPSAATDICVSVKESGAHNAALKIVDEDVEKDFLLTTLAKHVKKSRKRKCLVEDSSRISNIESDDKSATKPVQSGQSDDVVLKNTALDSSNQDSKNEESVHQEDLVSDQHKDQSVSETSEDCKDIKRSSSHRSKSPNHQIFSMKSNEKERALSSSSQSSSPKITPKKDSPGSRDSRGPERQRRTKQVVSYAEPSISKKLRRGDPHTDAFGNSIKIFKSPKLQGTKKKKSNRNVLESLQNFLVSDVTILE